MNDHPGTCRYDVVDIRIDLDVSGSQNFRLIKNDGLDRKELKSNNKKIMLWVKKHKYKFVDFEKNQENNFFNINTQEDLNKAKKIKINNVFE